MALRILSLLSSATEMVYALGAGQELVGRSHECDYPTEVLQLPTCSAPKFVTDGRSYEIDQRVRALIQEGLSVYRVDADRLKALQPDVILTQTQCEVCAVSQSDLESVLSGWLGKPPVVVSLRAESLAEIWQDVRQVAAAIGRSAEAEDLIARVQARMAALATRSQAASARPSVACIEWIDPLMASGNWMPELVQLAGGCNLFGTAGTHAPWLEWEAVRAANPELILALPCGFDLARTMQEMVGLTGRAGWDELQAVQQGRVYLLDGNQYFNRPGPRIVESLEILGEIIHPELFSFGHEVTGWERWSGRA